MEKGKHRVNRGPNMMGFWAARIAKDKNKKKRDNNGFSLVELIIVIAIISILAAAVTPALIRYIDKSRKAVDIASAEVLFKAAEMAATTGSDDAMDGWNQYAARAGSDVAHTQVTRNGYRADLDKSTEDTYHINCIAWARGVNYNQDYWGKHSTEWQNALFKCTLDKKDDLAMTYTDEFLSCLLQDKAKGEIYKQNQKLNFHGYSEQTIEFKFKKALKYGQPECWMLCIKCETGTPEIWIGDKNFNGRGGTGKGTLIKPLYRIYPDPCDEYKN